MRKRGATPALTFDGSSYYQKVNGDEVLILPRLEGRDMIRAILGVRGRRGAFEFSYDRTEHRGTFMGEAGDATFQKDGGFLDPDVGNGRFRGFGVNTEAGVTVYAHPRFGISAGYRHRVMWFDRATGVSDTMYELRPRFRETSGSVVLTGLFTF